MDGDDPAALASALARATWQSTLQYVLAHATVGHEPVRVAQLEWAPAIAYAFSGAEGTAGSTVDAPGTAATTEEDSKQEARSAPVGSTTERRTWASCLTGQAAPQVTLPWDDRDPHLDPLALVLPLCCWEHDVWLSAEQGKGRTLPQPELARVDGSLADSVWDPQTYVRGRRHGTPLYPQNLYLSSMTASQVDSHQQTRATPTGTPPSQARFNPTNACWQALVDRATASTAAVSTSLPFAGAEIQAHSGSIQRQQTGLPHGLLETTNLDEKHLQALEQERARQSMNPKTATNHVYVQGDADQVGGLAFTGRVMESTRQPGFALAEAFQPSQGDEVLFGIRLEELEKDDSAETMPAEEEPVDDQRDTTAAAAAAAVIGPFPDRLDAGLDDVERMLQRLVLTPASRPGEAAQAGDKGGQSSVFAIEDQADPVDFDQQIPHPALHFPFELDRFQKQAILHIERGDCVFVAAHTSAGKTVVAEYAIALAQAHATKAIYTSPIKTLSNQKFRDFSDRFGAATVGLITGDVSIQPTAPCLIMTTEILRSMLYRGADLIRDVEWVIFDEVHYLNDEERGVVWEEVIILLPEEVNLIMLSATVPNAREFAEWVGRCKQRTVYVVTTSYRPVPLQHYLYAKNELILVKNARGEFLRQGYKAAQDAEQEVLARRGAKARTSTTTMNKPAWSTMVHFLRKRDLMPAVVFCFSRKRCEEAADSLGSMDLLERSATARNRIHVLMESALSRLSEADRRVPQIRRVRDLVQRGIGIHHAGLLPIVKELTEILFQRGLVRVLFATETFAMGVNMPARTVVFSGIRKHDGRQFRLLTPGEYTQMSGRAGRRGLDAYGLVMLFFSPGELPSELDLKRTMTGVPPRLSSQFRLSYNMILNLIRTEHVQVEEVIRRSFTEAESFGAQHRRQRLLERGRQNLERLDAELTSFGHLFSEYYAWVRKVVEYATDIHETLLSIGPNGYARVTAVPGRLLLLRRNDGGIALGVILGVATEKRYRQSAMSLLDEIRRLVVPVLVLLGGPALNETVFAASEIETGVGSASAAAATFITSPVSVFTEPVRLAYRDCLHGIEYCLGDIVPGEILTIYQNVVELKTTSSLERALLPVRGTPNQELLLPLLESLRSMTELLDAQLRRENASETSPLVPLQPRAHCGSADLELEAKWLEKERYLHGHILRSACLRDANQRRLLAKAFALADRRHRLEQKLQYLAFANSYRSLQLLPDYEQRLAVLQRLGYVERAGNAPASDWELLEMEERPPSSGLLVTLKGRAACEVGTCDSLLLVETILEGTLSDLQPSGIAALLSCLVFQEKLDPSEYLLPDEALRKHADELALDHTEMETLATALTKLRRVSLALGTVQAECGLPVSPTEYQSMTVNPGLLLPTLFWARGAPFKDICEWTPVQEGSIVRTIVRLSELLREAADVARVIGDSRLLQQVDSATRSIKRDIIFAASLYVT